MAAKKLGMKTVPCVYIEGLTEEQYKAYVLADNRLTELGEWDMDLVTEELRSLKDMDFDISLTGFDIDLDIPGIIEDEPVEPDRTNPPISKEGDIWQLGDHRLMCGDSTSIDAVERLMGGHQADLLLTDPPYNVDYTGKTKDALKIQNDSMAGEKFREFLYDAFITAYTVMKTGAAFYVWYASREHTNFDTALRDAGFDVKQQLIWEKNTMVLGRQDYQWKHEPCLYGWKKGASHSWYSDRRQTTVLHYDKPIKSEIHPTMKPVELFNYQIRNSTKAGDIVLDLFNGSGTTIAACEQNERKAYCMELDPYYVDAAIQRWENLSGKKAILLKGEE